MKVPAFPIFDADSHVYEPAAIWERYVEPAYRVAARSAFWHHVDAQGLASVVLNSKAGKAMNRSRIVRQAVWRPGMTPDSIGAMDASRYQPINPGSQDAKARLRDMDELGVERALLFPTLFAEYLPVVQNPDVAYALARGYNDWLLEFCDASPKRLYPVAVLPTQDIVFALEELRRMAAKGVKAAFIRPVYTNERFLNYTYFYPLFEELERLNVAAFVHPSPGTTNPEWASTGPFVERVADNLRIGHNIAEAVAPVMDAGTALVGLAFCGHLEEYPKLKLAIAHAGASWVPLALEKVETFATVTPTIRDISLEPGHVFVERPSLVTFDASEVTVARMPDFFATVAAWGSRYPHHDTSTPQEAIETLRRWEVPEGKIAAMMGGNVARFLGV
ncbi:MAG: amidohydrolase family protein [Chloroflexi bacterium]|nr:amidohydrolase family protein [Chloroflexota bacterium]